MLGFFFHQIGDSLWKTTTSYPTGAQGSDLDVLWFLSFTNEQLPSMELSQVLKWCLFSSCLGFPVHLRALPQHWHICVFSASIFWTVSKWDAWWVGPTASSLLPMTDAHLLSWPGFFGTCLSQEYTIMAVWKQPPDSDNKLFMLDPRLATPEG